MIIRLKSIKMLKNKISFLSLVALVAIAVFSCSKDNTEVQQPIKPIEYQTMKIGEFSSFEIGESHNISLSLLKESSSIKKSQKDFDKILSTELPKIDNRFTSKEISDAVNNLYSSGLLTFEKFNKAKSIASFQENVLNFLVSQNEISKNAKLEIDNLSILDIESMKLKTNELINSNEWTNKEKKYFAVYTSVYENSMIYWNNPNNISKKSSKTDGKVYAADAAGAVLGLWASPIWSIIQGALASYIADDSAK